MHTNMHTFLFCRKISRPLWPVVTDFQQIEKMKHLAMVRDICMSNCQYSSSFLFSALEYSTNDRTQPGPPALSFNPQFTTMTSSDGIRTKESDHTQMNGKRHLHEQLPILLILSFSHRKRVSVYRHRLMHRYVP